MAQTGHYTRLPAWDRATNLVKEVYRLTAIFPNAERNGLSSNLQQDVLQVPSSIADSHSSADAGERIEHLARGRQAVISVEASLRAAVELSYLDHARIASALALCDDVDQLLASLQLKLRLRIREPERSLDERPEKLLHIANTVRHLVPSRVGSGQRR